MYIIDVLATAGRFTSRIRKDWIHLLQYVTEMMLQKCVYRVAYNNVGLLFVMSA